MAPTPYSTTHQLDIHYTVDTLEHVIQLPVNSQSGSAPFYLDNWLSGTILVTDAVDDYAAFLADLLLTTSTVDTYVLQRYDNGVFIPEDSGAIGINGTVAGANVLANQTTLTFRDTSYRTIKHVLMELPLGTPNKYVYPATTPTPVDVLIADLLDHNTAGKLGAWIRSRGDGAYSSIRGVTTTYNRKLRRARGFL